MGCKIVPSKYASSQPVPRAPAASLDTFVVPVTVMLAFVSFWRASAIILCDLGSSAYYVGGIAEKAIGNAAPWFVLAYPEAPFCERTRERFRFEARTGRHPKVAGIQPCSDLLCLDTASDATRETSAVLPVQKRRWNAAVTRSPRSSVRMRPFLP